MISPNIKRKASNAQIVIERRPHPHSTRNNPWQFRCVYFDPTASCRMYVVMDSRIYSSHGNGMTYYTPQPTVYMNWFQELHDPNFPIESQWFDISEINNVTREVNQDTGAVFAMTNYMLSHRRSRGIPWSDWSAGVCWSHIYMYTNNLEIGITIEDKRKRTSTIRRTKRLLLHQQPSVHFSFNWLDSVASIQ